MPFPFRLYIFSKQFDGRYILNINMQTAKDRIFGAIFEHISQNIKESIKSLESLEETGWLVFGNIRIIVNNKDACLAYVFNTTLEDDENIIKIPINNWLDWFANWQNLQKAQCEIIIISLVDTEYKIEGFYKESYAEESRISKELIKNKILEICKRSRAVSQSDGEAIEAMLVNHLCKYPADVEMWMRLAKLEFSMCLARSL